MTPGRRQATEAEIEVAEALYTRGLCPDFHQESDTQIESETLAIDAEEDVWVQAWVRVPKEYLK